MHVNPLVEWNEESEKHEQITLHYENPDIGLVSIRCFTPKGRNIKVERYLSPFMAKHGLQIRDGIGFENNVDILIMEYDTATYESIRRLSEIAEVVFGLVREYDILLYNNEFNLKSNLYDSNVTLHCGQDFVENIICLVYSHIRRRKDCRVYNSGLFSILQTQLENYLEKCGIEGGERGYFTERIKNLKIHARQHNIHGGEVELVYDVLDFIRKFRNTFAHLPNKCVETNNELKNIKRLDEKSRKCWGIRFPCSHKTSNNTEVCDYVTEHNIIKYASILSYRCIGWIIDNVEQSSHKQQ